MIRLMLYFLILLGLWTVVSQARVDSWVVGGPCVLLGALAWTRLSVAARVRLNPIAMLTFPYHFFRHSLLGGIDVTWRSLHPRLPIDPGLIEYPMRLPQGPARTFFMAIVSLLPGTVSADTREDVLFTHVLDQNAKVYEELNHLENAVARLFSMAIEKEMRAM